MDDKENIHTNRIIVNPQNIFANKVQTPSNGFIKLNTIINTPNHKDLLDAKFENGANSPPEHATPSSNFLLDKNGKGKLALNFGKGKIITKNQRNSCLKPPKKSYTINSNRNSSSDSSFSSLGQLGMKPILQEQFTPHNAIRGSFEIRNSTDFLNHTAENILRKNESNVDNFNPMFNATMDVRDQYMNELCSKGKSVSFKSSRF